MIRGKKGEYLAEFRKWIKLGYVRARIDGQVIELAEAKKLEKQKTHDIDLFIDRLVLKDSIKVRLTDSLETALRMTEGLAKIEIVDKGEFLNLSSLNACTDCGVSYPELEPRLFSFNNPRGACPDCNGLGTAQPQWDWEWVSDEEMESLAPCKTCNGQRLRKEALFVLLGGKIIADLSKLTAADLKKFLAALNLFGPRKRNRRTKLEKKFSRGSTFCRRSVSTIFRSSDPAAR